MEVEELREKFKKAENSEFHCAKLFDWLEQHTGENALYWGYLGAVYALKSKFDWNPLNKLWYIQKASEKLIKALQLDNNNLEVKFIRFSIEHNIPFFLGYSNHIDEDMDFMINNIVNHKLDKEMKKKIALFLLNSQRCNHRQKLFLEKFTMEF